MRIVFAALFVVAVSALNLHAVDAGDPVPAAPAPAAPAASEKPLKLMNDHCPVTGEEVNPELSFVWNGVEVRFCCEGCIPDFVKDPSKYMPTLLKDLVAQRETAKKAGETAKAPVAPPVAPGVPAPPPAPVAPAAPLPAPAHAAPVAPLAPTPVAPSATPPVLLDLENSHCPVMEAHPAKAETFLEYHGMKVRLCCKGCVGKFNADPGAYLAKLRVEPAVARRIDTAEAAWAASHPAPVPAPGTAPVPSR